MLYTLRCSDIVGLLDRWSVGARPCVAALGRPRGDSSTPSHHSKRLQPLKTINGHMILLTGLSRQRKTMQNYVTNGARYVCLSVVGLPALLVCLPCLLSVLGKYSLHSNDFNEIFNSQQREFIVLGLNLCTLRQLHVVWPLKNKHPSRVKSTRGESSRLKCCEVH